jgi:hypothetical protein
VADVLFNAVVPEANAAAAAALFCGAAAGCLASSGTAQNSINGNFLWVGNIWKFQSTTHTLPTNRLGPEG